MTRLLDNEAFLHELRALFETKSSAGSVFLTQKRLTHGMTPPDDGQTRLYPVLFRATAGKTKLSTRLDALDDDEPESDRTLRFHGFWEQYSQVCKDCMTARLRKRDRKKHKKKSKAKTAK